MMKLLSAAAVAAMILAVFAFGSELTTSTLQRYAYSTDTAAAYEPIEACDGIKTALNEWFDGTSDIPNNIELFVDELAEAMDEGLRDY